MATVPLSGTNIRLLSGVPFSNDYKHSRWFDNLSAQQNYFNARTVVHSMMEANFQRIEGKLFIKADKSIDELWGTNYIMFQNAAYNSKWFYAFVTKLEYVQKNTTYVHFEIDVLQTWRFEMNFKPSYVVREHRPLWNSDGTPVINTVDEGLNYGTDYDVVYANNFQPPFSVFYLVIVAKSSLHAPDWAHDANTIMSSLNGTPQPLCYYVHPFRMDGSDLNYSNDGMFSWHPLTNIKDVLSTIFSQINAVNNIVSMYITEHIGANIGYDATENAVILNGGWFQGVDVTDGSSTIKTIYVQHLPNYQSNEIYCGDKYFGYRGVTESKLLMYPYAITILDDFKGNRVVLKNEYIDNKDLYVRVMGSIGVNNKVAYTPRDYNTGNLIDFNERMKVALENALLNSSPQDISIITDMLSAYIQGNRNTLENQKNSILFNGVMDGVGSVIGGVASAAMMNPVGVASSATNLVKGAGNTLLQIQGMQAKIKDINNLPPQLAKMGSNTAFDYGNGYKGFYVIKKQIKPEYQKKLEDFFKMYGYKVNEVKVPNFHTRASWNYVQTSSCNITGNFNHEDLQEIKSVFDNGITLWHTDDVGNYSLGNGVIA